MTLPMDHLIFKTEIGPVRVLCKDAGIEWPPPERIETDGIVWVLKRRSQLPDSVADHPNLARGAEYVSEPQDPSGAAHDLLQKQAPSSQVARGTESGGPR